MRPLGYSTGAIALWDYTKALSILEGFDFGAIELSALRFAEVAPLITALPNLELDRYCYISFHAPSSFEKEDEEGLCALLHTLPENWPIVVHPDAIHDFSVWAKIESRLAIENMDRRKGTGRSVSELDMFFERLPKAKMCLDLGHARQVDSSMTGAYQLLDRYVDRIVQVHISEVDTFNRHDTISMAAELAFSQVRRFVPDSAAMILESRVEVWEIESEAEKVRKLFPQSSEWH